MRVSLDTYFTQLSEYIDSESLVEAFPHVFAYWQAHCPVERAALSLAINQRLPWLDENGSLDAMPYFAMSREQADSLTAQL